MIEKFNSMKWKRSADKTHTLNGKSTLNCLHVHEHRTTGTALLDNSDIRG